MLLYLHTHDLRDLVNRRRGEPLQFVLAAITTVTAAAVVSRSRCAVRVPVRARGTIGAMPVEATDLWVLEVAQIVGALRMKAT